MLRLQQPLPERYTAATPDELDRMIGDAKTALGDRVFILGHHYQRDEVMKWADARGDSYRLSVLAQQRPAAEFIVFCGVHFMAESADVLTADHQQVDASRSQRRLFDGRHGRRRRGRGGVGGAEHGDRRQSTCVPITYMNSSAALKAFVGEHGGAVCTSTNARAILEWALRRKGRRCCSSPTSIWVATPDWPWATRNPPCACGIPASTSAGLSEADCKEATFLLWKGHCSVHQRFRPEHVAAFRAEHPDGIVIAHPECSHDLCSVADRVGSTDFIIRAVEAAPPGSAIAVGDRDPSRAATGQRAP